MKNLLILTLIFTLFACQSNHHKQNPAIAKRKAIPANYKQANNKVSNNKDTTAFDEQRDAYADYYIVVVDTGLNYYTLRDKMVKVKQSIGLKIDTDGQYYNKAKDLIMVPDTSSDEIMAGDYYPRRFPSESLSLEYMNFYQSSSNQKTIALVAGIYEQKTSADSALHILSAQKEAFEIKSKVYVGCMH